VLRLGVDLGTGSTKALLLDAAGEVAGTGSAPHPVRAPRPGWAESDPEDWWDSAVAAVRSAVGGRGGEVEALGLAGQMHGVVLAGDDGEARRPAILWADARAHEEAAAYRGLRDELSAALGNPPTAGMAGPILAWLRTHEPGPYGAARWALQPKDWLRLRLTGAAATDPSDASGTLLFDLRADAWSAAVVDALGLRAGLLAPIRPSGARAGALQAAAASELGLRPGIPVAVGAADTAAAALAGGPLGDGAGQLTVGTGAQLLVSSPEGRPDPAQRTHLFRAAAPGAWYALAAMQNAGLALEWCLRALGRDWAWAYAAAFAEPAGARGVTFLPYVSGERTPHLDPHARGGWVGVGLDHGPGTLMRAALEGVAFSIRDGLDALQDAGHRVATLRLVGGGTLDLRWRQLLADVLARPLAAVDVPAASARGAALLAGQPAGHAAQPRAAAIGPMVEPRDAGAYVAALEQFRDRSRAVRGAGLQ
jgi:xylulokinase